MISSSQIRAARAMLRWTAADLALASGVGVATIRRIELAEGLPSSNVKTVDQIRKTFEGAGIVFLGNHYDSPGVRLNSVTS
jgi:transcriptional regulator with XRE-family HTH domain